MPPLLEREPQLARIAQVLDRARSGAGGAVMVWGPAGIGKSSLLDAARTSAADAGMRVLRARGAEMEREFGFGVVRQLFEPALSTGSPDDRAGWLDAAAGYAARLLGLPGTGADIAAGATSVDPSFQILHGLYWLCAQMTDAGPICVLIDDAQWADLASLRYLAYLLPRLDELPVAVVVAVRTGTTGPAADVLTTLAADSVGDVMQPAALSREAVQQMLTARLGSEPDDDLVARCLHATGGVPFLVEQLADQLRELNATAVPGAVLDTPAGPVVDRWVLTQLIRLGFAPRRLARAVAILENAPLAQAAELAELDVDEATAAWDLLVRAGIFGTDQVLTFAHPIVRRAVYDADGRAARSVGHRRAAHLLASAAAANETVAEHLLVTDPTGDAWVVDQLLIAAAAATRTGAHESAAAYLSRAADEPPPADRRSAVLLALGLAEFNAGLLDAVTHLQQAVAAATDAPARAAAAVVTVYALAASRDERLADSVRVLDEAITALRPHDATLADAIITFAASVTRLDMGLTVRDRGRTSAVRRRADEPDAPRDVLALAGVVAVQSNEPAVVAAELARRSVRAEASPLPDPVATVRQSFMTVQAQVALLWSEAPDAPRMIEMWIAQARESGDALVLGASLAYRGWHALRRGDLRSVEVDARTALEASRMPVVGFYRVHSIAMLIMTLVETDRLDEAEVLVAAERSVVDGATTADLILRLARGRLRLAQQRPVDALADFHTAGEVAHRRGFGSPCWLPWRSDAAVALLQLGEPARARELATAELDLARTFGAPRTTGVAMSVAGLTLDSAAGDELLSAAISILGDAHASLDQARAMHHLGARLRRRNQRSAARDLLREALRLADHLGAVRLSRDVGTELRAAGGRPRRSAVTGPDALTASERRVAELAVAGLSNRQIAQTLFVTARTVEGHLTSAFRKLGVGSRDELRGALPADGVTSGRPG